MLTNEKHEGGNYTVLIRQNMNELLH